MTQSATRMPLRSIRATLVRLLRLPIATVEATILAIRCNKERRAMTQAEIEAELISVRQQLSQLQEQRAKQKTYWRWIATMSLGLAFVFCLVALLADGAGSNQYGLTA